MLDITKICGSDALYKFHNNNGNQRNQQQIIIYTWSWKIYLEHDENGYK